MFTVVGFLQFVTISQPVNAIAFVADGLYYGVCDFAYAAYSTVAIHGPVRLARKTADADTDLLEKKIIHPVRLWVLVRLI